MRSMASRGALGGLSEATLDAMTVMDAFGKDVVMIETVGAGQDEVEIASTALTTVLINTPGTGDDIQAMKAGIMEIADVLVVNKADLPGADLLVSQLKALLSPRSDREWEPPVVKVVGSSSEGIDELLEACDRHHAFLRDSNGLREAERRRARHHLISLTRTRLLADLFQYTVGETRLEDLIDAVVERRLDPHSAVDQWIDPNSIR